MLLLSDVTLPGGVGTHLLDVGTRAVRRGWHIVALLDQNEQIAPLATQLRAGRVVVERGALYPGHHDAMHVKATVMRALQNNRPDVVHVHCGSPRSALLAREVVLRARVPLIITEHFVPPLLLDHETLKRIRAVYRNAYAVISVCNENRRRLRSEYGLLAQRHFVIRYSVELPSSAPNRSPRGTHRSKLRLLCVARLTPQKGVDTLVRALGLADSAIQSLIHVTIAGDGEERGRLAKLAADLGMSNQITFLGWCNRVPELLVSHDAFILPSRAEGQPIALMEALAAGLPCVASAVSGIPELLGGGSFGELVPPDDPEALAAALGRLSRDPQLLRARARAASPHLRKLHDPDANAAELLSLWQSAAHHQHSPRS